jgi:hypothetical protein
MPGLTPNAIQKAANAVRKVEQLEPTGIVVDRPASAYAIAQDIQLLRVTGTTKEANGWPAKVVSYVAETTTWTDLGDAWVVTLNDEPITSTSKIQGRRAGTASDGFPVFIAGKSGAELVAVEVDAHIGGGIYSARELTRRDNQWVGSGRMVNVSQLNNEVLYHGHRYCCAQFGGELVVVYSTHGTTVDVDVVHAVECTDEGLKVEESRCRIRDGLVEYFYG